MIGTRSRALATRVVDHAAIAHNARRILDGSGTELMAVVKANAFGHGAVAVSRTALAAGATWLGVATIDEALELRAAGIEAPIFAWLVDPWVDLRAAAAAGITVSVANLDTLAAIDFPIDVHLELDTGMSRGGCSPLEWGALCAAAAVSPARITGVWSHLADASLLGDRNVDGALSAFRDGVVAAHAAGLDPRWVHLANSAGALAHPATALTMVRSGAALYGIETVTGAEFGLEPALRVTSRVSQLRQVPAGTGVGYLHAWVAPSAATLALVPVGYGDGLPRALSTGGSVSIGGHRFPIRGAISMDQLVVEVDASVALGDEVVLLGDGRHGEPTAAEWAALTGTIPHEILTGLGARIGAVESEARS
ncbi:alanine racemase [Glaciihabitans arcticus]|uniref:Alanine racemase n=1 Tax=Glaciihabitans arcticus TaxID=2668039 RepID=A0A4Q9GWH2_9MICO|nr:alanine racemase [Glaciihabitans arcticus]TBN57557.1 alanine racemase [Glaciihabitans arcticus]